MSPTPESEDSAPSRARRLLTNLSFAVMAAALLLLLILQVLLLSGGSWKVPDVLVDRLHQQLAERDLRAAYTHLRFRLPARIMVTDLQLGRSSDDDWLASVEVGQLDFSLPKMLRGDLDIEKITFYGGAAFCPALLSPTGLTETIMEQAHLVATQSESGWQVQNFNGRIENLAVTASGHLPRLPKRREQPPEWESVLDDLFPRFVRERDVFKRLRNPSLRIRLSAAPDGAPMIGAEAWAERVEAPEWVRVNNAYLATTWSFTNSRWQAAGASFALASLQWDSQVTAREIEGKLVWTSGIENDMFPKSVEFFVAQLETPAGSLTDLQTKLVGGRAAPLAAEFFVLFQDAPLEGRASFDWQEGSGQLDLLSRVNPTPFLQHEIARELGLRRDIFFHEPLFARAAARVEKWQFTGASGHAHARQADIDGVFMNRATARVELLPDRFLVPELVLAYDDFEAYGSYEIDFATKAYRFLFEGNVRPLHISAWFEDWWVHLWEDFDFPQHPLRGDVDIHSVLGQSEKVKLVGSIGADNFFLRGVPFESVDAKLVVLHKYADLYDIDLTRSEGKAKGSFQYWADPATSAFAKLVFEVDSTVNPTDLAQVFKEAGTDILSPFRFTEPPALKMAGIVFGEPKKSETRVDLSGNTMAALAYQNIPLDHLAVEARIQGDAWTLPRLQGGFAGGTFEGHIKKWTQEGQERLEFALLARDTDLPGTLAALSQWRAETGVQEVTGNHDVTGIFDLNIEASGLFGDFQSFIGSGSLQIRQADLAEVHLLGLLSRILSVTPLGFTSLQFDEAEARFDLELNKIHVPAFQLKGPTSAISGSGDYLTDEDKLDFLVKLHFLRESRIPFLALILSPVLEPLAHAMEIRLTGTLAEPEWRFLLGPSNILSGVSLGEGESEGAEKPEKLRP